MKPVRLCAFADEAGTEVAVQIAALKENGVPCLEVRGVDGKNVTDLTLEEARQLRRRLEDEGLSVWSVGSPLGKIGITDAFGPHLDKFKYTLDLAQELGAACIRLFSFFIPKETPAADCRGEVLDRLAQFCRAAEGRPVILCHENEKEIYGDIADRCLDIHQQLPALRAVFDPANFVQCGQDTLAAWKLLAPYVHYMHIKDALTDGRVVPAGKGEGHVPEILAAYRAQGGEVLTLEPHLAVFSGLSELEHGEKSVVDPYAYPTQRAAFDAAVQALKDLL